MTKNSNPTLKDIAKATGYSLSSIHRAVYNKEGLGKTTREEILKAVHDMGYEVNYLASSLKRKSLTVGYVGRVASSVADYHSMMADGARAAFSQFDGMNIVLKELLFDGSYNSVEENELEILNAVYSDGGVDGLVIFPMRTSMRMQLAVQKIISKGIPVVLVDDTFPKMDYLCSVVPESSAVGRTAAEFMMATCHSGRIIVTSGYPDNIGHRENANGFINYMAQYGNGFECIKVSNDSGENSLADRVFDLIDDSVVGLYAVCETDSHCICNAAIRADRPSLRVVGCDLGAFNRENLDKGVFTCIIDTDPYQQGYTAMVKLIDFLLKNSRPESRCYFATISIVMRSNLPYFEAKNRGLAVLE